MTDHYSRLERMYLSANINTQLFDSTTITISEKRAQIELPISEKFFHALGAIHGSVYFKMLDDAAFFAANSVVTDVFVLTKSFDIHFKRPVSSGVLKAIGSLTESKEGSYFAASELFNEEDKVVAYGSGEFVKSQVQLSPEIGYE